MHNASYVLKRQMQLRQNYGSRTASLLLLMLLYKKSKASNDNWMTKHVVILIRDTQLKLFFAARNCRNVIGQQRQVSEWCRSSWGRVLDIDYLQSINESINQWINGLINQSTNQWMNQSIDQSINQSTLITYNMTHSQSIDRAIDRLTDGSTPAYIDMQYLVHVTMTNCCLTVCLTSQCWNWYVHI